MITLTQAWQGKGGTEIQVFFVKIEVSWCSCLCKYFPRKKMFNLSSAAAAQLDKRNQLQHSDSSILDDKYYTMIAFQKGAER